MIFGKDGLINAKDLVGFEVQFLSLSNTFLDTEKKKKDNDWRTITPEDHSFVRM